MVRIYTMKPQGESLGFNNRFLTRYQYGWSVLDQFNFNYRNRAAASRSPSAISSMPPRASTRAPEPGRSRRVACDASINKAGKHFSPKEVFLKTVFTDLKEGLEPRKDRLYNR